MRAATLASLVAVITVTAGPRFVRGADEDFVSLLEIVDQIREDLEALRTLSDEKDAEIERLQAMCISSPTPSPAPQAGYASEPSLQPTRSFSSSSRSTDGDGSGRTEGKWTPRIGDSWNYNLATPVDTDTRVDVFFIDMGER